MVCILALKPGGGPARKRGRRDGGSVITALPSSEIDTEGQE